MKEKFNALFDSLDKIKQKFHKEFKMWVVPGTNATIQPDNFVRIGIDFIEQLSEEQLKAVVFHESFHQIFSELNQNELARESERIGKRFEEMEGYWKSEIETWEKVKEEFPDVSDACDFFIEYSLKIIKDLKN